MAAQDEQHLYSLPYENVAGANDYNLLSNLPSLNGVRIAGNKTSADYGLIDKDTNQLENYYLKSETYTQAEIDLLLDAFYSKTQLYTKTETDTMLALKANADEVYTKTEVDNIINNLSQTYYTKTQVDSLLQNYLSTTDINNNYTLVTEGATIATATDTISNLVDSVILTTINNHLATIADDEAIIITEMTLDDLTHVTNQNKVLYTNTQTVPALNFFGVGGSSNTVFQTTQIICSDESLAIAATQSSVGSAFTNLKSTGISTIARIHFDLYKKVI